MGRLSRLKREHIRKTNELLEAGGGSIQSQDTVSLNPSTNITGSSRKFIDKMNNLKEDEELGGMTSDPRIMAREYGADIELTPGQKQVHDAIMSQIGQNFASWMSPNQPPFAQEYAKGPYWDNLSKNIRDIIINLVE